MQFLKADTTQIVSIGPCIDILDGYTPLATLDISAAGTEPYLIEQGATLGAALIETDLSGNTWTPAGIDGWYNLTLTGANLDTEGKASIVITDVDLCLPIFKEFMVVNANVYDSLFAAAATDYLKTDMTQVLSGGPQVIQGTIDGTTSALDHHCDLDSQGFVTDNALIGRTIIFDSDTATTAALKGQAATITDYIGATGHVLVASGALTVASDTGDTFTIV